MTRLQGFLYNDAGTAIQGATVTALEAGTTTTIGSTDTTDSNGSWQFTSGLTGKNVDVKIQSGSSIRYIKHADHIQVEHAWIRSDTAAGTAPLRVENATNSASNLLLELVGDNSTRADNDEIKVHFSLDNDAGEETIFARITAEANDVSNGTEDGELKFGVMVSGTLTDVFTINSSTAGVTDMNLDVSGDLTLDADGGDIFFKDGGTTFGSATNSSGNLIIKSGTTTALTFTGADVAVAGDLTISGDDLKMATNTDTYILVADGTSYNPVAVSGDVTISNAGAITIANDAVESGMLNDNIISGQTEITSGLADADELLYSDGGTVKRVGLDTLSTKILSGTATTATTASVATTVTITDNESTNEDNAIIFTAGGDVDGGNIGLESDGTMTYNPSTGKITATGFIGALTGNADTATVATTVTITDNESTNEDNAIIFTSGGDVDGGNIGLESDGTLNYNPSSGTLTTTAFAGNITGNVTGNASGSAATVTGGTQTAITTLANLTTTGALNAGSITSGFTSIDVGAGAISTTGTTTLKKTVLAEAGEVNILTPLLPTTDHTYTGVTAQMLAGGAISAFDLVCIHTTTQEVVEADASAIGTARVIGIAPAAISDTATGTILLQGFIRDDTWTWTTGSPLYLSETAGAMTHTAPTTDGAFVVVVGIALSPDVVYINPSVDIIEHA